MNRAGALSIVVCCLVGASNAPLSAVDSRGFHLAFTPLPPDVTDEALDWTYQAIEAHADLIAHHFDDGVPWPEALAKTPYPPLVEHVVQQRLTKTPETVRTYLALTPISFLRDGLAQYWGPQGPESPPPPWDRRGLDHPKVIRAFTRHCLRMIEKFQPDFLAYAIEIDLLARNKPEAFPGFRKLARKVHRRLKRSYPDLPIFFTFTLGQPGDWEEIQSIVRPLLQYTDYLAVSTYPYLIPSFGGNPANVPPDWFTRIRDLDPGKPIAVAETGFTAEDVDLGAIGIEVPGKSAWQKKYVRRLLADLEELEAEFLVWFVVGDYDKLWLLLQQQGAPEFVKAWRDTGMYDENLKPRPALKVWNRALRKVVD